MICLPWIFSLCLPKFINAMARLRPSGKKCVPFPVVHVLLVEISSVRGINYGAGLALVIR